MKNVILILFCAASLFLAIYCYRLYMGASNELGLANQRILDRDTTIYKLQGQRGSNGEKQVSQPEKVIASTSTLGKLSASDLDQLKKKGLSNPEAELKESLKLNEKAVLAQKGTMGGTMVIRDIQILNGRHAIAYFEDGHQGGYMVLRYEVQPNNRIAWVVLDNYVM